MFKKFLTYLGALTFVLLIFAGIRYAGTAFYGWRVDKSSAAYANEAMKAITAKWDAQELVNRAHPLLFSKTDPQAFTALFDKIRQIGQVRKLEECQGQSFVSYPSFFKLAIGSGSETNAKYICQGVFERAPATLEMVLHKDEKAGWQILNINIDSIFFKSMVATPEPSKEQPSKAEDK